MKSLQSLIPNLLASCLIAASFGANAAENSSDIVARSLSNPDRPATEVADDERRKPQEVLTFAGIAEGMSVLELEAGAGYYTEILSRAVGPNGRVITQNPPAFDSFLGDGPAQRIANNRLPNVTATRTNFDELDVPDSSIDLVVWIQGPHELWFSPGANESLGDPVKSFAEIARVLKPGGALLLSDHIAPPAAGPESGGTLHRIREEIVTELAVASGLTVAGDSQVLKNESDPLTAGVFDPSIQGKTSQFIVLYRK